MSLAIIAARITEESVELALEELSRQRRFTDPFVAVTNGMDPNGEPLEVGEVAPAAAELLKMYWQVEP